MRKLKVIVLSLCIAGMLSGCGKSDAAVAVDEKIQAIGTVSLESETSITDAETAYSQLSDKEREQVEYHQMLVDARTKYDKLLEDEQKRINEEQAKTEGVKNEIEALIKDHDIEKARSKIDSLAGENSDIKNEMNNKIKSICYQNMELVKLGEIVSEKPESSKENQDEGGRYFNYYYYGFKSDAQTAFDDYCAYLNKYFEKTDSELFGSTKSYDFKAYAREVNIMLYGEPANGSYLLQIVVYD